MKLTESTTGNQPMKSYSEKYLNKLVQVKMDRPMWSKHAEYGFVYPVNYGYIPNTLAPDGEELDAYILWVDDALDIFEGRCIALIHRTNDQDDKLIVVPDWKNFSDAEIRKFTNFQEQYFESVVIRE